MEDQQYDVLANKYNLIKNIGNGATATVKLAQEIGKGEIYAVKLLSDEIRTRTANLKHFNAEVENLKKLMHENIINLIDSGTGTVTKLNGITKQKNFLVLEYAENCELFDYIYFAKKGLGEYIAKGYFKQLLLGLQACHKAGVAHRDLKTENLMLTDKWQLKIADFGYATSIEGKNEAGLLSTFLGTLSYAAPEIISKKFYKAAPSDVFSCGVILYVMVTGGIPFGKAGVQDAYFRHFVRKDPDGYWKIIEPKLNIQLSKEFKSLLNSIFTYDPDKRATIDEIFEHEWLKGNLPTNEELIKELESRKKEVQTLKELEMEEQVDEEDGYGGVYRSGKVEDDSPENIAREVRDYVKSSNPYKVLVKDYSPEAIYKKLLTYFDKTITKDKSISKNNTYLSFNANFNLDEDLKELVDENFNIETLEIQVEVKKVQDSECIVEWNKIKGDRGEFFTEFQQFVQEF